MGPMAHRWTLFVQLARILPASLLSVLLCVAVAQAQSTDVAPRGADPLNRPISELLHRSFTAEQGTPVGICWMVQTPDGFLWLATRQGLFRFDGVSFVQMYQGQLPASGIIKLWADKDGSLWIGSFVNGVSHIKDGVVTNYSGNGLPNGTAFSILRRPDGKLWVATTMDVAYLDGDHWVSASKHYGLALEHPELMSLDTDGTLWITRSDKSFSLAAAGKTFQVEPQEAAASSNVGLPSSFGWTADYMTDGEGLVDSSGALWLATVGGFKRFRHPVDGRARSEKTAEVFSVKDGLTGAFVSSFLEDRDENMWVATQKGLDLFRRPRLTRVALPGEIDNPGVAPGDHGDVWITSFWQNTFHLSESNQVEGQFSLSGSILSASSKPETRPSLVLRDRFGSIWFAGINMFAKLRGNRITHFEVPAELKDAGTRYQSLAVDEKGAVWVTVSALGLWRYSNGIWSFNGGRKDLPVEEAPLSLAFDPLRGLWLGYPDDHMVLLHDGKVQNFDLRQGLRVGGPLVISELGRQLWVGGDAGISFLLGGHFHELVGTDGQRFQNTTGIVETKNGELWINGGFGIFRIPATEVKVVMGTPSHQVAFEQFNALDGLDGASTNIRPAPSIVIGVDGRIWATTSSGAVWIDPEHIPRNRRKPTPVIESISDDDHSYSPVGVVHLPKRTNAIRVDYTAPVLGIPERAQFRYRLIGFDSSWQSVQGRRQAFYTNLPPAKYRFELQASNEDGVWSDAIAKVDFDIAPTFWQTPWFKVLWIAAIVLALALLYVARIKRLELRERIRRNERERIARDMHDTLLQSTQGLALQLGALSKEVTDARTRQALHQLASMTNDTVIEGRDKVRFLRAEHGQGDDLVTRLTHIGAELGHQHSAQFTIDVEGRIRSFDSIVVEEIERIMAEALINAFRHANATEVRLTIAFGFWRFVGSVADNGDGIDEMVLVQRPKEGHWGVHGMRERAAKIGARFAIGRRQSAGTQVLLVVSASRAYAPHFFARAH